MTEKTLSSYFAQNRIEEDTLDLWGTYVLPINYNEYNLLHYEKSVHITGGRGIGKTAYILYHCYPTILSSKKESIHLEELKRIGIYWKPDSEILSDINDNILDNNWTNAFNAYIGISLILELSRFLKMFIDSKYDNDDIKEEVKQLILPQRLVKFLNIDRDIKFLDLEEECHYLRTELIDWLCFPNEDPLFKFKAKEKISLFIREIQRISVFSDTRFYFFLDEFENLDKDQQKIINTWIKHVDQYAIFHITYKKHYTCESSTVGNEKIQEINDYRVIDIEDNLVGSEDNFNLLASEIIINRMQIYFQDSFDELKQFNFEHNYLSQDSSIEIRSTPKYKDVIKTIIARIFPAFSLSQISKILIDDDLLSKKVKNQITKALLDKKIEGILPDAFFDTEKPEETILNGILLNRERIKPMDLLKSFNNEIGEYTSWKNNNLLGAILFFYNKERYNRKCPYYGGFDRFVMQSALNIRHLLELVHQSFVLLEKKDHKQHNLQSIMITVQEQAEVARLVSTNEFDRKIEYFGNNGKKLKNIVERLGQLFTLIQNNPAQSFAEMNQFAILYSTSKDSSFSLSEEQRNQMNKLLDDLKIWSVIIEKNNTKLLDKTDHNSLKEYRLHPILSSYFGISPRQKRKYDFSIKDIKTIFLGNEAEYKDLYERFRLKNSITDESDRRKEISLLDLI